MPEPVPVSHVVNFAEFQLDLRAGELFRSGQKVRIQERPLQVLSILLHHAGELVTREQLRERIWPADTFVDFDHSVAVAVSKVREALRDSAEKPRFIETVGRRGYRFLLPAETPAPTLETAPPLALPDTVANETAASIAPVPPAGVAARSTRWLRLAVPAGALVLLLAAVTAFLLHLRSRETAAAMAPPTISSLAVLPLENISNDPEQEYFVEGMTDEIITDLAKLPGLRVISRTSAVQYKGTHKSLPEIARELNVDAVVEGTVMRQGDRVRIRAQLIYAPRDQHLWAEAYEGDLKDVFALQAEVAEDIAGQIRLALTSQQQQRLAVSHPIDPEAHELYLKGRYFWNKRDPQDVAKSVQYFQQAIERDPNYAAAYAGLADAYVFTGSSSAPAEQTMAQAKVAAEKALQLDSNLADAHAALGLIAPYFGWNWTDAKRHYELAIALNPNYATGHHWYAEGYLIPVGQIDQAIAEMRKAQELDPLSPVIATDLGKELYFARRYDDALVQFHHALELDPNFYSAHNWLSDTYLEKGMYQEAIAELEKAKPYREERLYVRETAYLYARMGRRADAEEALAKSLELSRGKPVNSGAVALIYAGLGEKDKAFSWLYKACAENAYFMTSLKYWSVFDILRADPRFDSLLQCVGLPR
jgi:TolB-like protein/DNA-binding winged helix-turn-helix (wHTH) protein/Tfp pilus assembly protein PilF